MKVKVKDIKIIKEGKKTNNKLLRKLKEVKWEREELSKHIPTNNFLLI